MVDRWLPEVPKEDIKRMGRERNALVRAEGCALELLEAVKVLQVRIFMLEGRSDAYLMADRVLDKAMERGGVNLSPPLELLSALRNMVALAIPYFTDDVQTLAIKEARAAIAKAEGKP